MPVISLSTPTFKMRKGASQIWSGFQMFSSFLISIWVPEVLQWCILQSSWGGRKEKRCTAVQTCMLTDTHAHTTTCIHRAAHTIAHHHHLHKQLESMCSAVLSSQMPDMGCFFEAVWRIATPKYVKNHKWTPHPLKKQHKIFWLKSLKNVYRWSWI